MFLSGMYTFNFLVCAGLMVPRLYLTVARKEALELGAGMRPLAHN